VQEFIFMWSGMHLGWWLQIRPYFSWHSVPTTLCHLLWTVREVTWRPLSPEDLLREFDSSTVSGKSENIKVFCLVKKRIRVGSIDRLKGFVCTLSSLCHLLSLLTDSRPDVFYHCSTEKSQSPDCSIGMTASGKLAVQWAGYTYKLRVQVPESGHSTVLVWWC
jgi:hypothetical protein